MFERKKKTEELVPIESSRGLAPLEDMERWFEEAFRSPFSWFRRPFPARFFSDLQSTHPSVDIYEEGDDLVVKAELPGMTKDEIKVNLVDDVLTVSGEKKREEKVETKNYYRMESSSGSFTRSFRLPVEVQADKAKARFSDGVLQMRIPKTEKAKARGVEIKVE